MHTHGGFAIGFRVHYMSLEKPLHMTMLRQCMPNPSSSQVKLPGPLPSPPDIKVCDMQVMTATSYPSSYSTD